MQAYLSKPRTEDFFGLSKGKLTIGKESRFWIGKAIEMTEAEKKTVFELWFKCPSSLVDEKEHLHKLKNERKNAAAKEILRKSRVF